MSKHATRQAHKQHLEATAEERAAHITTASPRPFAITNTDPSAREVTFSGVDQRGNPRTETARVSPPMWWNNIRRAWMTGPVNAPVMVDPQPPPFGTGSLTEAAAIMREVTPDIRRHFAIPPAVKVSA